METKHQAKGESYEAMVERMNRQTSDRAQRWYGERKKVGLCRTLFAMAREFVRIYFGRRGFMRGFDGFQNAVSGALYELFTYAKYWELIEREKKRM